MKMTVHQFPINKDNPVYKQTNPTYMGFLLMV